MTVEGEGEEDPSLEEVEEEEEENPSLEVEEVEVEEGERSVELEK